MSIFNRVRVTTNNGLLEIGRQGQGMLGNLSVAEVATDAALTMTVAQMSGGAILYTGFTVGRVVTTPTAALILAAAPDMDIGDSFMFWVSISTALAATWAAGTGVTLRGRATVPASGSALVVVARTGLATFNWSSL